MIVCDSDRPFMRGFSHDLEEIDLQIPREVFLQATGLESLSSPLVVDFARRSLTARTSARLSGRAARASDAQSLDEDLVLRLLSQLVTGSSDDVQSVHLATARAYIEEHLSDPALGAGHAPAVTGALGGGSGSAVWLQLGVPLLAPVPGVFRGARHRLPPAGAATLTPSHA